MAVSGVGSSAIDVNSLVSQLMNLERKTEVKLQKKLSDYNLKLSSVSTLNSALSSFKSAMDKLRSVDAFKSVKATSGDTTVLTAAASSTAVPGNYNIEVSQLAKANMLSSSAFADTTSAVATGTLTVQVGSGAAKSVTIDSTNNTLSGIRDAINKAAADVTASIVNDGTGYKLVLTAKDMGADNKIKVTVTGDSIGTDTDTSGLSSLVYDPAAAGTKNMTEIQAAQSSILKMGNMTVTKSSNTVTDFIDGVTLNMIKAQPGTALSLNIENDASITKKNVNDFVGEFNKIVKSISDLQKAGGSFSGDGVLRSMDSEMRSILTNTIPGLSGSFNSLSQVGIKTNRDGTLSVDDATLSAAITNNFSDIVKLFAKVGSPTDPNISFVSSTNKTAAGSYAVNIAQAATKGNYEGGGAVGSLIIDSDVNDGLTLNIDGVSGSITLAAGTYATGSDLAAEIQSKINGLSTFSIAGISATIAYDSGTGKLTVTSNRYGSASTVNSLSGTAAAGLGLNTGASTDGLDTAGTIGGFTAIGSGQKLTGGTGTDVEGLVIEVKGAATGSRGTLTYSVGTSEQLYNKLDQWLDSYTGVIKTKTDSVNSLIKNTQGSIDREDVRLEKAEKDLRAKYTALDQLLSSMQTTNDFLNSQMTGLYNLIKR